MFSHNNTNLLVKSLYGYAGASYYNIAHISKKVRISSICLTSEIYLLVLSKTILPSSMLVPMNSLTPDFVNW